MVRVCHENRQQDIVSKSWYVRANVPGKPQAILTFPEVGMNTFAFVPRLLRVSILASSLKANMVRNVSTKLFAFYDRLYSFRLVLYCSRIVRKNDLR